MGESFTALPSNPSALLYNPAGLAGLTGVRVSYSQRSLAGEANWTLRSLNTSVETPIGVFAAQYNRDDYGTLPITVDNSDRPSVNTYDYDIAIGYAVGLGKGFSMGVAVKYYGIEGYTPDISSTFGPAFPSAPARLFDVGLTYTFRRFHSQAVVEDSLTIGTSYQNIGSAWSGIYSGYRAMWVRSLGPPQYFRGGLSYALKVVPRTTGDVSPFQAVISTEYRSSQTMGSDAWGFGMECTINEFLSVRTGGLLREGGEDNHIRYGLGVRLPFQKLGFDLQLQYAVIPWYSLSAFSIDIEF